MSISDYKNKIESYISKKDNSSKELDSARGLLAPKGAIKKEAAKQMDAIANISEFIYAIRQKRKEILKNKGKKNGS
jgi:hypothetical protein